MSEGAALSDTFEGYRNFGYLDLAEEYDVKLVDLNRDEWVPVQVYDRKLAPMETKTLSEKYESKHKTAKCNTPPADGESFRLWVRVAKTALESDFRIAVGPPKTHDVVVVTASLKNMVVGSLIRGRGGGLVQKLGPLTPGWLKTLLLAERFKGQVLSAVERSDKFAIHQGYPAINLNLYVLARLLHPHLSVIDGFVGMEGAGPIDGDPVDLRIAIASTDFLAADTVATRIMGFDIDEVGYLHYCKLKDLGVGDLNDIEILGNATIEECARKFRPHPTYRQQLEWRIPEVKRFL